MSLDAQVVPGPELSSHLKRCQRRIGYDFSDEKLLQAALTHASGAEHRLASNERLEFLGDAILGAVVCELLYQKYPDYLEGVRAQVLDKDHRPRWQPNKLENVTDVQAAFM